MFPLVQLLTSAGASFLAGLAFEPEVAGRLASAPDYILTIAALSQILALALITAVGRPIFMPSWGGRSQQLRLTLAVAIPVLLLTLGVQFFEAGALALLDLDLGRYQEIADLILQADVLVALMAVALIPGICEEFVFREVIQPAATHTLGPFYGILYTSTLFAVVHLIPVQMLAAFIFGLVFGYIRYRTGSIYPAVLAHVAANTIVIGLGRLGASMDGVDPSAAEVAAGTPTLLILIAVGVGLAGSGILLFERHIRRRAHE